MAIDRGLVRATAVAVGGLVVVIGLVAALGGFRPALASGRSVAPRQAIDLQRWTISVEGAAYVDASLAGLDIDPAVRVWLRITNTTDETIVGLPVRLISVQVDGVELAEGRAPWGQPRSETFDPAVELQYAYDFPRPGPAGPAEIDVLVRDESLRSNFVIGDDWRPSTPAATVRMACPDHRLRR